MNPIWGLSAFQNTGYFMTVFRSALSRRTFLGLLGTTALARTIGLPSKAAAATTAQFQSPPLMSSLEGAAITGDFWDRYTKSFSQFITAHDASAIERERPPSGLQPDSYTNVAKFYAVSPMSRHGVQLISQSGATTDLWGPAYTDMFAGDPATIQAVGPTMEFKRGEVTGVWVHNQLLVCGSNPSIRPTATDAGYTPHNFDYTNLHTHGLHVSPRAPSDDVLVTIVPEEIKSICTFHADAITAEDSATFPYYYDIPESHPIGTFWYHPHMHGAVASQVGPGMSGALLIRSAEGEVDFDEALAIACNIQISDERVMVFQSIGYNNTQTADDGKGVIVAGNVYASKPQQNFICTPSVIPGAESLAVGETAKTGTTINGIANPNVDMRPGQILRFRMVNASNGNTYLPMIELGEGTPAGTAIPEVYAIAVDGIPVYALPEAMDGFSGNDPYFRIDYDQTRPGSNNDEIAQDAAKYWTTGELITLAAAQRLDILIQAPDLGGADSLSFAVVGGAADAVPCVVDNPGAVTQDALFTITVSGAPMSGDEVQTLPTMDFFNVDTLRAMGDGLANATLTRPELPMDGAPQPVTLNTGEMLEQWISNYVPDLQGESDLTLHYQDPSWKSLNFAYVAQPSKTGTQANFQINGQSFDANLRDAPQLTIPVNGWTSWELFSSNDIHMFHIHINSFMVLGRYKVSENTPQAVDEFNAYLMPIWRDTAYFDAGGNMSAKSFDPNSTVGRRVAALSYQIDYTGEFVFHCHSLYHEDNGMMFTVEITS